ncbi:SDR family NAD(P)-dependent oxidoreductase [Paraglaciecola arctica]|uniref:SDR family NAD(P)-dependent oxidoreductase n=1 Tax=Paraglaciecola arctica TaxID=1128911 RepID=UPI001C079846|nr:SDR family oxidoreductase [Paraglaciecola arctica]MBU3005574.1 SDR family oxidoreductase [Paraglaciecola arctica]
MTTTYSDLKDKTVLVSGGAGGIGAAIVKHFCQQSAVVAFLDVNHQASQQLAQTVYEETGVTPIFQICDLRDSQKTRMAVNKLIEQCGEFNVLVNNAGHDEAHSLGSVTPEYWDDRVAVNLKHQYFLTQQVATSMQAKQQGAIINLGSISWMMGAEGVSVYTTMKSAVMGMTKSLARELGHDNIRVNSIAPGWVLTERQLEKASQYPQKLKSYLDRQCLKTHLQPKDIAKLCLWLASDESCRLTGQTINYDGGVI